MTDLATLTLAIDSTQVKEGTAALDGLSAAGARAEASTLAMGAGSRTAAADGMAMATAAQAAARAAMDQAAGFKAAASAASLNTIAMRETLVVARELARGNYTRIPGSLSLLAQGIGSQGGIGSYASALANMLGLVKKVQDAELAEAATAAANAAAGVQAAAQRAAANVMAADTEVALAEAQVRVTEGTSAEAAAQVRLATAHEAVGAAAAEAAVAEDALATAIGRANEAQAASAAATKTVIGGTSVGLIGLGVVAGIAWGAIKQLQDQVKDDGTLTQFRDNLGLTHDEMLKLSDGVDKAGKNIKELGDVTVTFGDVMHGVWQTVTDEAGAGGAWDSAKSAAASAFDGILKLWNVTSAAITAGFMTIGDIARDVFGNLGAIVGDAFYSAVNIAIDAINGLAKAGTDILNGFIAGVNKIPGVDVGQVSPAHIANVGNPYAGAASHAFGGIRQQADKNYAAALAANNAAYASIKRGAEQSAEDRMTREANALKANRRPKKPKKPKKPPRDEGPDIEANLDKQILSAKMSLAGTAEEQAALALQQITIEKDKTVSDTAQKLAEGKITAGEAQHIDLQAQQLAELKAQAVLRKEQTTLLTQQQASQDQLFGFQIDALKAADDDASSQAEHRKIQLEMLDIQYRQKEYDLEILESKQKLAGDLAAAAITQANINHLPTQYAFDKAQVISKTENPLQQWADKLPSDAASITEALQGIEVKGFDGLASAIAGVVTGTESMKKAFTDLARSVISQIVEMTVKMLIFQSLSSVFGSMFGGGSSGGGMFGTDSLSSLGNLSSVQAFNSGLPTFSSGGSFIIGGNPGVDQNVLSLNGSPIAMVGQGETLAVYPNAPPGAANNNESRQIIEVRVATDENFNANVQQIAGATVVQAIPVIVTQSAKQTIRTLQRPSISGGR